MRRVRFTYLVATALTLTAFAPAHASATSGSGVGNVPQGVQSDKAYANSVNANQVSNVSATTQQTSCYTPEVPYLTSNGPNDGYSGMSTCDGASTTGENLGSYPTQAGSNSGYPASTPMLVKDHSESDIRVDPTNPNHLIGSSKWFVSAEGYNHLLGFYESLDGGKTWPVQGHIPGYEGWTDNTDPVGAFDGYGNYYEFNLAYQFFYNSSGSHNYTVGMSQEPNPTVPAEVVSIAVRPHGATAASTWITAHNGQPDYVATYDSVGNEPDKQWITIDNSPLCPHYNRVYVMWVDFHSVTPVPFIAFAVANKDGTHTAWSIPQPLPLGKLHPTGDTYLLPHVDPNGNVYTTLTNFNPAKGYCCASIILDKSIDGGNTWAVTSTVIASVNPPPSTFANTTFRDGIEDTFTVGSTVVNGHFPLYASWEDYSAGVNNVILSASFDGGYTWSNPVQVNDNLSPVDEFQPNLTVAGDGTVSNAFYDRRLACPGAGTAEAVAAGIALDQSNAKSASLPPYNSSNYCVNASVQFYTPTLTPIGHNIRLTQHTWDPQLNSPHPFGALDSTTFIGDYFGNTTSGKTNISSFVSTYNDGSNPSNRQEQVVARVAVP